MNEFWKKLNLRWRMRHPVEGIVKPLARELSRQLTEAVKEILRLAFHAGDAVCSAVRITFSWPGILVLWGMGLWAWGTGVILGVTFLKLFLVAWGAGVLHDLAHFVTQKMEKRHA